MTIPVASLYPENFDSDTNLYLVHDALRVTLAEDYMPGDTTITVTGSTANFPPTGLITLTDQCNPPYNRALTFFYSTVTTNTFSGLILLDGFTDIEKPYRLTDVTMNVVSAHHNNIKDALIAIETFIGVKGTTDVQPLGKTMEGRINFLRNLVLRPRAWFSASQQVGVVPLNVTFTNLSFRNPTFCAWNFGDNTTSTTSTTSNSCDSVNKVYYNPGLYTVTLTVTNDFGTDVLQFPQMISARLPAPEPVTITFTPQQFQSFSPIDPSNQFLYDHLLPGTINAAVNTLIDLEITNTGEQPGDPVIDFTWKLNDDTTHDDAQQTNALFTVGGIYDIRVREDTLLGAYFTTVLPGVINIIEQVNLFLYIFDPLTPTGAVTGNVSGYEFGLLSQSFKANNRSNYPITRNYNFLNPNLPNYSQQLREFLRNSEFAQQGTLSSGSLGNAIIYNAEGAPANSPPSAQTVGFIQYEGFADVWNSVTFFEINRPWNWVGLNSPASIYLFLGTPTTTPAIGTSPTNQTLTTISLQDFTETDTTLTSSNYINGASELMTNTDPTGISGVFSVYRSTWMNSNGYLLRNDGVGPFFRIKSFYQIGGTVLNPFQTVDKLPDIPGSVKLEGELVSLTNGVYFFDNSGEFALYNTTSNTWLVGASGPGSPSFRSLQDVTVPGFDSVTNTLVAASDGEHMAYLSFDYSTNAFIQFNETDLSFTLLPSRPMGEQFVAGVY